MTIETTFEQARLLQTVWADAQTRLDKITRKYALNKESMSLIDEIDMQRQIIRHGSYVERAWTRYQDAVNAYSAACAEKGMIQPINFNEMVHGVKLMTYQAM